VPHQADVGKKPHRDVDPDEDEPSLGLRIWQLGSNEGWVRKARTKPDIHVITGEVLASGKLTGLNLVREQAVSITQHRFGALQEPIL
jgi:hypothetical protein